MFDSWLAWYREAVRQMIARGTGKSVDPQALEALRDEALESEQGPLGTLVSRLGLDGEDVDFLACVLGASCEPTSLAERGQYVGDASRGLDLATFVAVSGASPKRAGRIAAKYSGAHPLVRQGVIERVDHGVVAAARYRAPLGTIARLTANDHTDPDLSGMAAVPPDASFSPAQEGAMVRLAAALAAEEPVLVVIEGAAGSGKRTAVQRVARARGLAAPGVDLAALDVQGPQVVAGFRALSRAHAFGDVVPLVAHVEHLAESAAGRRAFVEWQRAIPTTIVATSASVGVALPLERRVIRIAWPLPDATSRRQMWSAAPGVALDDGALDELAYRYQLGAGAIARAASTAGVLARGDGADAPLFRHLVEAIHGETAERLQSLATRTSSQAVWNDLVIGEDTLEQIQGFVARVRHSLQVYERWQFGRKVGRARGASALFSGAPGTGKTMVAGLIAKELGLELYQVDLSRVVSKWVGETEKQLGALFDAAAGGHVMLLFDEADALFAKRSKEVRSATDRYANLEVNYLLQRIEAFGGVSILTTNLDTNLDEALRRRLSTHVVFWPPDEQERCALWRTFLEGAPLAPGIEVEMLAERYSELCGGHIKNAVVSAAFVAASRKQPIDHPMLEAAARAERAAMGKVLTQAGPSSL